MSGFDLDPRLARDTFPIAALGLCELRLMNDRRWPWLILVPRRPGITELHDLAPLDQATLAVETALVAKALKESVSADKLNIAAIGNVVAMLHQHVVARFAGDANWPRPVWGFETAVPYEDEEASAFAATIRDRVLSA